MCCVYVCACGCVSARWSNQRVPCNLTSITLDSTLYQAHSRDFRLRTGTQRDSFHRGHSVSKRPVQCCGPALCCRVLCRQTLCVWQLFSMFRHAAIIQHHRQRHCPRTNFCLPRLWQYTVRRFLGLRTCGCWHYNPHGLGQGAL